MKMAKAPRGEWERVMKFAQELEHEIKYREKTNEQLGAWVRKAPPLFRVIFGYQVLVDNCCDPNEDILEFKPELRAIAESKSIECGKYSIKRHQNGHLWISNEIGEGMQVNDELFEKALHAFFQEHF